VDAAFPISGHVRKSGVREQQANWRYDTSGGESVTDGVPEPG
jgi:hypothetical protein